jgi:homoserine O-acetyltransferase
MTIRPNLQKTGASLVILLPLLAAGLSSAAAVNPAPFNGNFVLTNFHFTSGESLPEVKIHYLTLGTPSRNDKGTVTNAVLLLHGTMGSGNDFLQRDFAGALFGPGQPLDSSHYYLILPDNLGHGQSTKPSDGLHAKLPNYGYRDMVQAQYRLVTEGLSVDHLRLVLGASMGGMHTWMWGETYPEFMDALMPLASLPNQMSGRNRIWRRIIIDAIRNDPDWQDGDYQKQPRGLRLALEVSFLMGESPVLRQKAAPTLAQADQLLENSVNTSLKTADANNLLYAYEASHDYDPGPDLDKIQAPLVAVNSADDLINPPELGILEVGIKQVPHGRAVVLLPNDRTRGHATYSTADLWQTQLAALLKESER